MIRTLDIGGGKELRLSNSIAWTMIYRDQFGHDIVSTLAPLLAGCLDLVSEFLSKYQPGEQDEQIDVTDLLKDLDGDVLLDALAHLSGLEFVDLIHITWSMAKACDDSLPDPRRWVQQFDEFPVDIIAPEVAKLAFKGMVSLKNMKRLMELKEKLKIRQPSN